MRKAINGLLGVVNQSMKLNPGDEAIFLFCGRSRRVIKMLYWDGNGFCLWQKRLEGGSFAWPDNEEQAMELSSEQLRWLLTGVDFRKEHKLIFFERSG